MSRLAARMSRLERNIKALKSSRIETLTGRELAQMLTEGGEPPDSEIYQRLIKWDGFDPETATDEELLESIKDLG